MLVLSPVEVGDPTGTPPKNILQQDTKKDPIPGQYQKIPNWDK